MLAQFGGLALAGVCCLPLAFARRREPGAWLLAGAGTLVIAISQWDALFMAFSSVASVSQSKRLQFALPWELGLVLGLLLVAGWSARLWREGGARRATGGGLLALAAAVLFGLAWRVDPLVRLKAEPDVPQWPIQLAFAALVGGIAWQAWQLLVRLRSGIRARHPRPHGGVVVIDSLGRRALVVLLAAAALPVLVPFASHVPDALADRPSSAARAYDLAELDPALADELRDLPTGALVMAPPAISLRLAALAPVYITSAPARHVAGTDENRRAERLAEAKVVYGLRSSDAARVRTFEDSGADVLILERADGPVRARILAAFERAGLRVERTAGEYLVLRRPGTDPR